MPLLEQLLETYPNEVKVVFKNFPLRMHKYAMPAAIAVLAAHEQGKFWPYHDKLFENYNRLNDQTLRQLAAEVGLDMIAFEKSMKDKSLAARVNQDGQDGQKAGVRGTPAVFVNGKLLRNRSREGFKQMVDKELAGLKK